MQDKIIKFLAYNKKVSIVCAKTTNLVEETRKIHDLSPVATAAFGRLITISAIMASNMKNKEDKLTIQIKGNGPIQTMLVTANNIPELKGYVANPYVDIPLNEFGKLDVGGAVGNEGYINVIKDIGLKDPYVGISPLTSGEIADDFTNYFAKSEQTNSAVALGVLVNKEIFKIEQSIFKAGAISKMLDEKLTLEEIAKKVTGDDNVEVVEDDIIPVYKCNCSKETMEKGLLALGKNELEDIIKKDGKAELVCHFCNKRYEFSKEELEKIANNLNK